jgi:hypothetical protein
MHLLSSVAIQPNLELKTRPKQLLGSLPLVIALPGETLLSRSICEVRRAKQAKPSWQDNPKININTECFCLVIEESQV